MSDCKESSIIVDIVNPTNNRKQFTMKIALLSFAAGVASGVTRGMSLDESIEYQIVTTIKFYVLIMVVFGISVYIWVQTL